MKYEDILDDIYGKGYYNILMTILCSVANLICTLNIQSTIFLSYPVDFKCSDTFITGKEDQIVWVTKSFYYDENESKDFSSIDKRNKTNAQCYGMLPNKTRFACSKWTYYGDVVHTNYVTKFDLVCDKQYLNTWLTVAYLVAIAVGYIFALVATKYGRRKLHIVMIFWQIISQICLLFTENIYILFLFRILRGFPEFVTFLGMNYITELSPVCKRAIYGNLYWISWGLGYMACSALCFFVRDVFYLQIFLLIPMVFYIPLIFLLMESPRWLTMHGQNQDAIKALQRMSEINKAKLKHDYFEALLYKLNRLTELSQTDSSKKSTFLNLEKSEGFRDLLQCKLAMQYLLIFVFSQTAISFVYMGVSILGTFANENPFISIFIQGLAEIPSMIFAWLLSSYIGRKVSSSFLSIMCGISVICMSFVVNIQIAKVVLGFSAKFCLVTLSCITQVFLLEIAPTSVRTMFLYIVHSIAGFVAAFSPLYNEILYSYIAFILYGIFIMISGVLMFVFLPETMNAVLPQSLSDISKTML